MHVKNDIGIIEQTEDTLNLPIRDQHGVDDHKGVEAYIELNVLGGIIPDRIYRQTGDLQFVWLYGRTLRLR